MIALLLVLLSEKVEMVQGVSGARSDDLAVQSGGVVLREGEAGAAFATLRHGKEKPRLAYFLVLRHRYGGEGKTESNEDASAEGLKASARHSLTIDGTALAVSYAVTLDAKTKRPATEVLKLGDRGIDLAKGRVLLVDMTASPPKWEQRKLELPADIGNPATIKGAMALAEKGLASLAKQDARAQAFIGGSKR